MKMNICQNCIHDFQCALKNNEADLVSHSCNEHEAAGRASVQYFEQTQSRFEETNDLCATCDNKTTCVLRDSEFFIFNCEHYK